IPARHPRDRAPACRASGSTNARSPGGRRPAGAGPRPAPRPPWRTPPNATVDGAGSGDGRGWRPPQRHGDRPPRACQAGSATVAGVTRPGATGPLPGPAVPAIGGVLVAGATGLERPGESEPSAGMVGWLVAPV